MVRFLFLYIFLSLIFHEFVGPTWCAQSRYVIGGSRRIGRWSLCSPDCIINDNWQGEIVTVEKYNEEGIRGPVDGGVTNSSRWLQVSLSLSLSLSWCSFLFLFFLNSPLFFSSRSSRLRWARVPALLPRYSNTRDSVRVVLSTLSHEFVRTARSCAPSRSGHRTPWCHHTYPGRMKIPSSNREFQLTWTISRQEL